MGVEWSCEGACVLSRAWPPSTRRSLWSPVCVVPKQAMLAVVPGVVPKHVMLTVVPSAVPKHMVLGVVTPTYPSQIPQCCRKVGGRRRAPVP